MVDDAREAAGLQFAEVVAAPGGAGLEVDAGDDVVAGAVAVGAAGEGRVLAVGGVRRRDADLRDGVAGRVGGAEVVEGVEAGGVRGGGAVDGVAEVVGAGEADDGPFDAGAGGEDAVVVRVVMHPPGERAGAEFAELVVVAVRAAGQDDGERVIR